MKKLIYQSMINPTTDGGYQMAEVNTAEYSDGWDGDTKAYLDNLNVDDMEYTRDENILANVEQNFGGHDPLPGSIFVVMVNGKPTEIYWSAYACDEEDLITAESFGSDIPLNWEEIAAYMNEKIKSGEDANEVWEAYWSGDYADAPSAITERYEVEYQGGESRQTPGEAVDYMLVTVPADDEEVELYAEMANPTWNEATDSNDDDAATYDELKAAIIAQAKQHGINPVCLKFWYDD